MRWLLLIMLATPLLFLCGCKTAEIPGLQKLSQASGLTPSDEEQIAAVMDDVCQGMQTRRIFKVLAHVSRAYHDAEGRDYAGIEAFLNAVFKNYREIRITRVAPRVLVQGDRARVVDAFGAAAEPVNPQADPPINVQGQVNVDLVKVGGEWQIVEWGRLQ